MHPVTFDVEFALERDRLTTFFRLLLVIPWIVVGYLYGIAAVIVAIIAWFGLMFTGRYPAALHGFVAGWVRYSARVAGFLALATDAFPPFSGGERSDYPVRIDVGPAQGEYSRAKTFFKIVLYVPQALIGYGVQLIVGAATVICWFRILVTGKQSATMHDAMRVGLAYYVRSNAFLLLLTEVHPRLLDLPPLDYPVGTPALPPASAAPGLA